jgi:microcystin-dependent protein
MALQHYLWSRTSASNSSADPAINWAEGQAPSSVNDSARAMMASAAGFRDDIAGAIVTGGTSTAYTVGSYQVFNSLANMNGQIIAFSPHATNGATVTLNVDGLGAKPLRSAPSTELLAGTLIQGTPYLALYNNSDAVFYLHGLYGNPYNVPLMGGMDYWDTIAPNSSFIFPAGQAISRTTYAAVFARWGTTYGVGDGSTTFNVPDKTERVSVMKASVATRLTPTYFGGNSTVMGAVGGSESDTLTLARLPTGITSTGTATGISAGGTALPVPGGTQGDLSFSPNGSGTHVPTATGWSFSNSLSGSASVTSSNTSGNAHNNVQPTIVCNYIIRII